MKTYHHLPILMYHGVRDGESGNPWVMPWLNFQKQVAALRRWGYTAIHLRDLVMHIKGGMVLPHRPVILTFDDGFAELYDKVFPLLFGIQFTGTVFLPMDHLGKTNAWDKGKGLAQARLLSAAQAKELKKHGAEFGSHGLTHRALTGMPVKEIRRETGESKKKLEQLIGERVVSFAHPYNAWDELTLALTEEAGYECAVAIDSPARTMQDNLFLLRRVYMKPDDSLLDFRRKISIPYLRWRGYKKH